jgi:hypothetical protein
MLRSLRSTVLLLCLPVFGKVPQQSVQVSTTERVEFAAGGTVRVNDSEGQVDVEGWDRPEVEITVVRRVYRNGAAQERDAAEKELKSIAVKAEKKGGDLEISTAYLSRKLTRPFKGKSDMQMEYSIKMPREAHLVIRHEYGDVRLSDVTGGIDVSARGGDLVVMLPAEGHYAIDAQCTVGGVSSDFAGTHRGRHWVGERFDDGAAAPASTVRLRVGVGGIQILKTAPK